MAHVRNVSDMSLRSRRTRSGKSRPTLNDLANAIGGASSSLGEGNTHPAQRSMRSTDGYGDSPSSGDFSFQDETFSTCSMWTANAEEQTPFACEEAEILSSRSSSITDASRERADASRSEHHDSSISIRRPSERLSASRNEQLYYSRKARPIQYRPKTLKEYRRLHGHNKAPQPLGKLKPNLNAPELVKKRAAKERIKAFSERLREVNASKETKKRLQREKRHPFVSEEQKAVSKRKLSARERAIAFSKTIPKPVSVKPNVSVATSRAKISVKDRVDSRRGPVQSKLDMLRARHEGLSRKVEAIKGKYGSKIPG